MAAHPNSPMYKNIFNTSNDEVYQSNQRTSIPVGTRFRQYLKDKSMSISNIMKVELPPAPETIVQLISQTANPSYYQRNNKFIYTFEIKDVEDKLKSVISYNEKGIYKLPPHSSSLSCKSTAILIGLKKLKYKTRHVYHNYGLNQTTK